METNFNLGSLKIVHTPLMDYFKKVQSNVSENLTLIREEKKVATNYEAIDHLRKIQSSLKMIGLQGLVKVLSLVQESLKEIKEVKYETQKSIQILEVSQLILQEIEYYIQNLLAGELDQPTQLFTNYKNLADLINKPVSIKDLFVPKLEMHNSRFQEELKVGYFINETNKTNLISTLAPNAEKLEQSIHTLISGIEKEGIFSSVEEKNDYQTACRNAYEALNAVQELKLNKTSYVLTGIQKLLVCMASPVFNDNFDALVRNKSAKVIFNLNLVNQSVQNIMTEIQGLENGEKTGSLKAQNLDAVF